MKVLVIDAQGGGIGRQVIGELKKQLPEVTVTAVGTNATATAAMLKAGADEVATGENAIRHCCERTDVIVGPLGVAIADSMLGEITPAMAQSVGTSHAQRILIPFRQCDNVIVGLGEYSVSQLITMAVQEVKQIVK